MTKSETTHFVDDVTDSSIGNADNDFFEMVDGSYKYSNSNSKSSTKRKRCEKGKRKNRRTGLCQPKSTKKRCANGTRKNKKTGVCSKYP